MPRSRRPPQIELPFDDSSADVPELTNGAGSDAKRRGRPRVWGSEAERKRAYRERKAAELAEPDRLRRELRNLRKLLATRDREVARLRAEVDRAVSKIDSAIERQAELEAIVDNLEGKVEDWRGRARALSKKLEVERERARKVTKSDRSASTTRHSELPDLRGQNKQLPAPGDRRP